MDETPSLKAILRSAAVTFVALRQNVHPFVFDVLFPLDTGFLLFQQNQTQEGRSTDRGRSWPPPPQTTRIQTFVSLSPGAPALTKELPEFTGPWSLRVEGCDPDEPFPRGLQVTEFFPGFGPQSGQSPIQSPVVLRTFLPRGTRPQAQKQGLISESSFWILATRSSPHRGHFPLDFHIVRRSGD